MDQDESYLLFSGWTTEQQAKLKLRAIGPLYWTEPNHKYEVFTFALNVLAGEWPFVQIVYVVRVHRLFIQ